MSLTREKAEQLLFAERAIRTARVRRSRDFLKNDYRRNLYGGWRHPNGEWITRPHYPAILMHEACKDPAHTVINVGGSNRSSKTWSVESEFASWISGERPWDGSKTAPPGSGRHWLMAGVSHSKAFPTVLCPYFEQRMGHRIRETVKNNQKQVNYYIMDTGDVVHCMSYEQHTKIGANNTSPFEGPTFYGAMFDEPPPHGVWTAVQRGLLTSQAAGWGKCIIGATPLKQPWMFNDIYQNAHNRGGTKRYIWAIEYTIWDNPYNTEDAIERFIDSVPYEERDARIYGRFAHLIGRVYDCFDEYSHVFNPGEFNPLLQPGTEEPSSWPVACIMDPHERRPPFIQWVAISPEGWHYIIKEWPSQEEFGVPYHKMLRSEGGIEDWARAIRRVEEGFPGGAMRVRYRIMDPNSGRSTKPGFLGRSISEMMETQGLYFDTEVKDDLSLGHVTVNTRLRYDTSKPRTVLNCPRTYTSEECKNTIFGWLNYTRKEHSDQDKAASEKVKDFGKDPMDTYRYCAVYDPPYEDWRNADALLDQQIETLARRFQESGIG
jgi:hypothetical protein